MTEPRHQAKQRDASRPVHPVQLSLPLVPKAGGRLLPFPAWRPVAVEDWLLHEFFQGREKPRREEPRREEPRPKVHRP